MKRWVLIVVVLMVMPAFGQGVVGTRPAAAPGTAAAAGGAATARGAAARPSSAPKNVEKALEDMITLDARGMALGDVIDRLRALTQTNIAVNWNAFDDAGVTRSTPVTMRVKEVTLEHTLRTLMEVVPVKDTKANFTVADNALEITTNAELATQLSSHLYDVTRALSYTFNPPVKGEEMLGNAVLFDAVIGAELTRAGDPPKGKGHSLTIKDNVLSATVSERGQGFINRALNLFNQPLKVGQLAMGTQYTAFAKRTTDAYKAYLATPGAASPAAMAKEPGKYGQFSLALLPGTAEELAKAKPDIGAAINDGGVLLLGPRAALRERTLLAIYDMRDVMKKIAAKAKITPAPASADVQEAIVKVLQTSIQPEGATGGGGEDLGKKPAVMMPYDGLLIVFATAETQRTVAGALQDMNK